MSNSSWSATDESMMRRALELAERGWGQVAPNPMVGAVLVRDGNIVGEGWHAAYGEAHAEVMAIASAKDAARGATLYVSLEPCNHHGRTPPCSDAVIRAGISRVVYATPDPNAVAQGGACHLSDAGVDVSGGLLGAAARELNAPFFHAMSGAALPWVTLKLALSIDGALVDASRRRRWLSGDAARREVHRQRAGADAIAVGAGTVLADDPLLTVRGDVTPRVAPLRVVFDREATLPIGSALVRTVGEAPVLVVTDGSQPDREARLLEHGVEILHATDLRAALKSLRTRGVRHLFVEGGATVASRLMTGEMVSRLVIFQAPVILGEGALAAFASYPASSPGAAPRLRVVGRRELGDDLMTVYAVSKD